MRGGSRPSALRTRGARAHFGVRTGARGCCLDECGPAAGCPRRTSRPPAESRGRPRAAGAAAASAGRSRGCRARIGSLRRGRACIGAAGGSQAGAAPLTSCGGIVRRAAPGARWLGRGWGADSTARSRGLSSNRLAVAWSCMHRGRGEQLSAALHGARSCGGTVRRAASSRAVAGSRMAWRIHVCVLLLEEARRVCVLVGLLSVHGLSREHGPWCRVLGRSKAVRG